MNMIIDMSIISISLSTLSPPSLIHSLLDKVLGNSFVVVVVVVVVGYRRGGVNHSR